MSHLILSPAAGRDIEEAFDYIAKSDLDAAVTWAKAFHERLNLLMRHPHVGRTFPDLGEGIRAVPFNRHLIFFRYQNEAIHVLHVLHTSRDYRKAWEEY